MINENANNLYSQRNEFQKVERPKVKWRKGRMSQGRMDKARKYIFTCLF